MRRLMRWTSRLAILIIAIALAAWFGRSLILHRLNEEIRVRVEAVLAEKLPQLRIRVRSAWLVEGEGVMLRGVTASPRAALVNAPMIKIDELLLACSTQMPQFLTQPPAPHHIELRGVTVKAARDADGRWNVSHLLPLPDEGLPLPTIEMHNCLIEIHDKAERPLLLRDVALTVVPQFSASNASPSGHGEHSRPPLQICGKFASEYCRQSNFDASYWRDDRAWTLRGSIARFDFSRRLLEALPNEIAELMEPLASLDVQADVSYDVRSPLGPGEPVRFHVTGRLLDGRVDDPRFPYALSNLRGAIDVDNAGLRLTELTASSGATQVRLSCAIDGYEDNSPVAVRVVARQLSLDHRVYTMLPENMQKDWDKFVPTGTIHADLTLVFDGERWKPELHVECVDVAVIYHKFPYRVDRGVGRIHLVDDRLWADALQVEANGQPVDVKFEFHHPGPQFTGWLELGARGPVPLDNELISALGDRSERIVRSLQPTGSIVAQRIRVEKKEPDNDDLHKRFELELRDCSLKYEKFPYPIYKIRGKLIGDGAHWTFRDLVGQNGSGYIICHGNWRPKDQVESVLTLDFDCRSVALEDELREALRPNARAVWNKLQPRGSIDQLSIGVRFDTETDDLSLDIRAQKWPPRQNVDGRSITIEPAWFPYRLEEVTGSIHVRDGVIELEHLKARHDRATVDLTGQVVELDHGWSLTLTNLLATQLELDRDLLGALPPQLAASLSKLGLVGPVSISGKVGFAGREHDPPSMSAEWDLTVDVENGRLTNSLPLQNIRGGLRLVGRRTDDRVYSHGELNIDSLMYQGIQFTQVRGPLWIDESGVLFGSWTPPPAQRAIPREVTARAFGGSLALDARVANQPDANWTVEARLQDASLVELSRELSPRQANVTGRVFTQLRLTGNNQGMHSWRGGGAVRLTDADVYKLPQMVALLKLLVIEPPDTSAFTNSDIDFRVEGDRIYFDRINFHGDAISLKGRGEMSLQRELNVHFYALVGRDESWPVFLRPIRSETAKSLLLIQVAGTLDDPKLTRRAFPQVEETLQQIFPEATRDRGPLPSPAPSSSWQSLDPRRLLPQR